MIDVNSAARESDLVKENKKENEITFELIHMDVLC